jgi:hypothetical protein
VLTAAEKAAALALEGTPSDAGGRRGHDELRRLCGGLASIYERSSGRRFKYDADAHGGGFLTPDTRWVARVARRVDPEVTDANLRTVLRDLRKPASSNR